MNATFERIIASPARALALRLAERASVGELIVALPNGRRLRYGESGALPHAQLEVLDDRLFPRIMVGGEIGFGETYMDGLWSTPDLVSLMEFAIANRGRVGADSSFLSAVSRMRDLRAHRARGNTKANARRNITAHYDLSNGFFALWLDETMTYSCAMFEHEGQSLADAQRNKYRAICQRAQISRDHHVLEIGSGWGGFAIFAAQTIGCHVTSITISDAQQALARQRIAAAGLAELVDVRLCDYRDMRGVYDRIVSIEMFEAVGAEYFDVFFRACESLLSPAGRMVMQTITLPDRSFPAVRDGVNWVQKYIFPGGMLPSFEAIERAMSGTDLRVCDVFDIGSHYALTLRHWREEFLRRRQDVRGLGFDDRFLRMWEYYLAASEAGFRTQNTSDVQIVFDRIQQHRRVRT